MDIHEKQERIVIAFEKTLDKDMAYDVVTLTDEEREQYDNDEFFQARLLWVISKERSRIIDNFRSAMNSDNKQLAFRATLEYAKILYPENFVDEKVKRRKGLEKTKAGDYDLSQYSNEELQALLNKVKK